MHARTHIHTHAHTHKRTHTHTYTNARTHTQAHIRTHTYHTTPQTHNTAAYYLGNVAAGFIVKVEKDMGGLS